MIKNVWHCLDKNRPITDINAYWSDKKEEVGLTYFLTECCPPDCDDSIEDYIYTNYTEMYYHKLAMIADDRAIAIDEDDPDREPYSYNSYLVKLEFMEKKGDIEYYNEYKYPVKAYKYGGKIKCKYI